MAEGKSRPENEASTARDMGTAAQSGRQQFHHLGETYRSTLVTINSSGKIGRINKTQYLTLCQILLANLVYVTIQCCIYSF